MCDAEAREWWIKWLGDKQYSDVYDVLHTVYNSDSVASISLAMREMISFLSWFVYAPIAFDILYIATTAHASVPVHSFSYSIAKQ